MESDRTGLLIIRTWIEQGSSEPLRAEIRFVTDAAAGIEHTLTFTRPEAVAAAVQEWLTDFVNGHGQS